MDTVASLLVLVMLPQLVVPEVARAVVNIVGDNSRIFSGERLRLRCSIPGDGRTVWNYLWFRGAEQLPQSGNEFSLWNANIKESGKISCQGFRDTAVGNLYTVQSLPVEINVDGGWAILEVPLHPGLVGDTLKVTCRVRGNPPVHDMILYKDGIEVMRQNGNTPHFYLTNLTLEHQGMYSCRASWDIRRRTFSVVSVANHVQILEVLSQPVLEIVADNTLSLAHTMKLICHVRYNTRGPAPPIHYYFYKNDNRLGTATSEDHDLVRRTPGMYSCKVKVPELGLLRWSEAKSFGQMSGPQIMAPPRPRYRQPLAPPVFSPAHPRPPAAQPTTAYRSTPAPTFIQRTEKSIHSSEHPLQFFSRTTSGPVNATQEHLSEESGHMLDGSGGISRNSTEPE